MAGASIVQWICVAALAILPSKGAHYDDEKSLRTMLLTDNNYQYKIRPASTVSVSVRLSLLNINQLHVPTQKLSVAGWLTVQWTDPRLSWTASNYGGITDIYDTENVFWRPELIVDNSVANLAVLQSDKLLIRVTDAGEMTWEPSGIYETHCDMDVTFYPFDTQTCVVEVTSWAYTLNEINMQATGSTIYMDDFERSGEWEILTTWTERRVQKDGADQHSQVEFYMKVRRKPAFYVLTILIPVIVTSLLCILVFGLPAESGEKVGYILTILLTYTVMLTLVASYMPPTSKHTSVLSIYLTIILFIGVFSTLLTVLNLYYYHQSPDRPIPGKLLRLTRFWLIPLVCWRRYPEEQQRRPRAEGNKVHPEDQAKTVNFTNTRLRPKMAFQVGVARRDDTRLQSMDSEGRESPSNNNESNACMDREAEPDVTSDLTWQEMAAIMDQACLRVMGIFVSLLTLVVLVTLIVGGYTVH